MRRLNDSAMSQSKLRERVQSPVARYQKASKGELADHFMEELRGDEALRKTVLEEVFELMTSGLEGTWRKNRGYLMTSLPVLMRSAASSCTRSSRGGWLCWEAVGAKRLMIGKRIRL
jgi:hypothetical protein